MFYIDIWFWLALGQCKRKELSISKFFHIGNVRRAIIHLVLPYSSRTIWLEAAWMQRQPDELLSRLRTGVGRCALKGARAALWTNGAVSCLCSSGEPRLAPHWITQLGKRLGPSMCVRGGWTERTSSQQQPSLLLTVHHHTGVPV